MMRIMLSLMAGKTLIFTKLTELAYKASLI